MQAGRSIWTVLIGQGKSLRPRHLISEACSNSTRKAH